jgi:hypothetical protein
MSYAYIQGQEEQALAYFKMLLDAETDPGEREVLARLVEKLKAEISKNQPRSSQKGQLVQNLPSNLAFA